MATHRSAPPSLSELNDLSPLFDPAAFDILPDDLMDSEMTKCEVGAQSSTSTDSARAQAKACLVCGDQAQGRNFGIVSCGSCKAFFRRNALKSKIAPPCQFSGSCAVTPATRSFCPACRLDKCLAMGMKVELIMSKEAKDHRKEQIERNRKRKLDRRVSPAVPLGNRTQGADGSSEVDLHKNSVSDSSSSGGGGGGGGDSSCTASALSHTSDAPVDDDCLVLYVRPVVAERQTHSRSAEPAAGDIAELPFGDESSVEVFVAGQFVALLQRVQTALATSSLRAQRRLNSGDEAAFGSLANVYESTIGIDPSIEAPEPPEGFSAQLFATRTSNMIRQLVLFAKEMPQFAGLSRSTQIRLLRAGAMPCILLRSAELLDLQSGSWVNHCGDKLTLGVLKQVSPDPALSQYFVEHLALCASFKQLVPADASGRQSDRVLFGLLLMITLLSPDYLCGVTDCSDGGSSSGPAAVSDAQQHCVAMLRRHLEAAYSFPLCAKVLPELLQQIGVLKRYSKKQNSGLMSCMAVRSDPLCQEVLGP